MKDEDTRGKDPRNDDACSGGEVPPPPPSPPPPPNPKPPRKEFSPFGIPTRVDGITYRSRVEARWGVMFGLLKWDAAYEPMDLAGYVPDYVIQMGGRQVLAEIKGDTSLEDLRYHQHKIVSSGWVHEYLILGARLFDHNVIGVIGDDHAYGEVGQMELDHAVAFQCLDCDRLSVNSQSLSWRCRLCRSNDGNAHVGTPDGFTEMWVEAGRRVQWRPGT